jgi:hypothetical protein
MNRNPEVDAWLADYDNPMKPVVSAMREAILAADGRIAEAIKWQAPTFIYKGNIASFFPKSKKHASLMFHKGATIRGDFPNLTGDAHEGRSFKVASLDDLEAKKAELGAICIAWCDQQDGG